MRWRHLPFYLLLIFSFWLLLWRLFDLTIIKGGYFHELSEGNRIQERVLRAARGVIYDRHGQVLARNKPIYKISFENLISREEALEIEARGGTEAANLEMDLAREYPWAGLLAHVVGYMGEVREEELKIKNKQSFSSNEKLKMGDFVGRTGVEEEYEEILRGVDGKELIEVDALGTKIKSLGRIEPKPGKDLFLSLDLDLQKVAAEALAGKTGVVLVSAPISGEILTLYSSPSFDPERVGDLRDLRDLRGEPFFNRAIAGLYPPGSTFKIITAAAGLETGKINKDTKIEDVGEIVIGPYRFPNWYWRQYGRKEGIINIVGAIKRSNDIFFYKVGEFVGIEGLEGWAKKFGLGKPLGIDLPGEAAGIIKKQRDWFLGDTYHVAIGQGDMQVTPLQMNFWTSVIANGGKLCQPHLTKDTSDGGRQARSARHDSSEVEGVGKKCKDIGLKKETIDLIKEGMREACSPGGTGWPLFNFEIRISKSEFRKIETACKTGTAEYGDPGGKTHAWFTVFAPVSASDSGNQHIKVDQVEPEISITVLVEGGGEGSSVAAPIAKKILEEWF
ncbi:hypothetical protein HY946_02080, partial [Candidatus Gottesmanbacteria bacterium]|nr:hypothetical protein [Candidatus Gottesmanbacteria bacterium]